MKQDTTAMKMPAQPLRNWYRIVLGVLLSAVLWAGTGDAAIRYAAPSAVGSGNCSNAANACSFSTAVSGMNSGDTVYLRPGTYSPGPFGSVPNGTSDTNRSVIAGDPAAAHWAATVSGALGIQGDFHYITWQNFRVVWASGGGGDTIKLGCDDNAPNVKVPNHMRLIDLEVLNANQQGILIPANQCATQPQPGFIEILNSYFHDNGTDQRLHHGIYINSDDATIDGNRSLNNAGCGIQVFCQDCDAGRNVTIRNNYTNGGKNTSNCGAGIISGPTSSGANHLIYNNIVRDSFEGILVNSSGARVYNNTIYATQTSCISNNTSAATANNICTSNASVFVNPSNDDFHLSSSDPLGIKNNGQNLSSFFTTDAEGKPRPAASAGNVWDQGAYEEGTGGGGAAPVATIGQPTNQPTFQTPNASIAPFSGNATDDAGVTSVTWACTGGCSPASGTASCPTCSASATSVAWSVSSISLPTLGTYTLTVTPHDAPNTPSPGIATLTVTRFDPTAPNLWYRFDNDTGTTALDSSTGNHPGTYVGGVTRSTPGPPGHVTGFAVTLNGTDGAITVPDPVLPSFGPTQDHTVCQWFQVVNNAVIGSGGFKQGILNLGPDDANGLREVISDTAFATSSPPTPIGAWVVTVQNGGVATARSTTQAIPNNTWTHLCHTWASGAITLYRDGQVATSVQGDVFTNTNPSVLGARTTTTGNIAGKLDEVKMWSRALSAADIATECNCGGTVAPRHRTTQE